ncbi:endonuclease [Paraferrimonas haliotis]|uniref:LTD domain-containing protein n=1 Tax=Paraferrimonas haliotis TaxID=2013866 RepID=A0AA37TVF4_9GAMM|nr:endonuclease [Paraferrimonas haliotis]GLS82586.1 hypothetical protein GCM10007894_05630 [Paraferrimonas haliotis]
MKKKISALATSVAVLLASVSSAAHANLVITEYIEGSSNNKAVEISNLGNSTIDLDASEYVLTLYSNGAGLDKPGNKATLTGNLAPGESVVFHNSGAADEFKIGTASNVTWFNGDDALVLSKDGVAIDRFGRVGERPSGEWLDPNDPDFSSKDKTLRRKSSVTSGDTDVTGEFPGANNEWVTFDINTSDGLGCPGEGACGASAGPGSLIITEYIEGTSNNKAIELSNVGGEALDLDASEYKLVLYFNGQTTPGNSETLSGMLEPGASIVFHHASAADEFKIGKASNVVWFNGDDAVVLYQDDVVIDRIGRLGERPKDEWLDPNDPNFSTKDKTLRRKDSIKVGETDATAPFPGDDNQWVTFPVNTADGLGCMGESACDEPPVVPDPDPEGPCNNCEELDPVADPNTFDPNVYYSEILNGNFDSPEAMRAKISEVIAKDQHRLTYKQVWTVMLYSDKDPNNEKSIIEIYTGNSRSNYHNGSGQDVWNREHVWAKSHGFPSESQLGYVDAHHLRPANARVNTIRSNYDFDWCSDTGREVDGAPGNYVDSTRRCFEPRDEVKGDIARMILYMDTRYQGASSDGNMPNLIAVDRYTTTEELAANAPIHGKLCTLYTWHQQDPVDEVDQRRNDGVYTYQGNRNPYIDNPDWVQQVYGDQCGDSPNPELDVDFVIAAPADVYEEQAFSIDASQTTAVDGSALTFKWEQLIGPALDFDAEQAQLSLMAPEVNADTELQFKLTVSDGTHQATHVVTVIVLNVPLQVYVSFDGNTNLNEADSTTITATVANAPDDVTYQWQQISGEFADYDSSGLVLNVTAPSVALDQDLVFALIISDGVEQVTETVAISVSNGPQSGWTKPDGAGSFGLGLLFLLPLALRRR